MYKNIEDSPLSHTIDRLNIIPPDDTVKTDSCSWLEPYRFPKGVSGHPEGRKPKQPLVTTKVIAELDKIDDRTGKSYSQLVAEAMVKASLTDPQVLKELLNRIEGKVTENIDIQGQAVTITYQLTDKRQD